MIMKVRYLQNLTGYKSNTRSSIRYIEDHRVSTSRSNWSDGSWIEIPLSSLPKSPALLASVIVAWRSSRRWPLARQFETSFRQRAMGSASSAALYSQLLLNSPPQPSAVDPPSSSSSSDSHPVLSLSFVFFFFGIFVKSERPDLTAILITWGKQLRSTC